jgi:competence protein ComEC
MKEMQVKNVIIGKQFEECENLNEFKQIIQEKNINVTAVEAGRKITIEKNIFFDVLWPESLNPVSENSINNNALVLKFNYQTNNDKNNFSMLFTGDIEEKTEKILLNKYSSNNANKLDNENRNNVLKSTILKVAHHGSKSSSTQEFINLVKPSIALIGVGENNLYGHPALQTIQRLENLRHEGI